jgi:hypothetical protein
MPADPITTTEPPAPKWLDNPDFRRLFVRVLGNALDRGGPDKANEVIRSLCDASGMQSREVIARVRAHLLIHPEHLTFH